MTTLVKHLDANPGYRTTLVSFPFGGTSRKPSFPSSFSLPGQKAGARGPKPHQFSAASGFQESCYGKHIQGPIQGSLPARDLGA